MALFNNAAKFAWGQIVGLIGEDVEEKGRDPMLSRHLCGETEEEDHENPINSIRVIPS
jgi:hypothetical protein